MTILTQLQFAQSDYSREVYELNEQEGYSQLRLNSQYGAEN